MNDEMMFLGLTHREGEALVGVRIDAIVAIDPILERRPGSTEPVRGTESGVKVIGSTLLLTSGATVEVAQSPDDVAQAMFDLITRKEA